LIWSRLLKHWMLFEMLLLVFASVLSISNAGNLPTCYEKLTTLADKPSEAGCKTCFYMLPSWPGIVLWSHWRKGENPFETGTMPHQCRVAKFFARAWNISALGMTPAGKQIASRNSGLNKEMQCKGFTAPNGGDMWGAASDGYAACSVFMNFSNVYILLSEYPGFGNPGHPPNVNTSQNYLCTSEWPRTKAGSAKAVLISNSTQLVSCMIHGASACPDDTTHSVDTFCKPNWTDKLWFYFFGYRWLRLCLLRPSVLY